MNARYRKSADILIRFNFELKPHLCAFYVRFCIFFCFVFLQLFWFILSVSVQSSCKAAIFSISSVLVLLFGVFSLSLWRNKDVYIYSHSNYCVYADENCVVLTWNVTAVTPCVFVYDDSRREVTFADFC